MINREEDPDTSELKIGYYRIGDMYCAYANSSYGKIMAPQFTKKDSTDAELEEYFDKATKDITELYNSKKTGFLTPNSLIIDPRRF